MGINSDGVGPRSALTDADGRTEDGHCIGHSFHSFSSSLLFLNRWPLSLTFSPLCIDHPPFLRKKQGIHHFRYLCLYDAKSLTYVNYLILTVYLIKIVTIFYMGKFDNLFKILICRCGTRTEPFSVSSEPDFRLVAAGDRDRDCPPFIVKTSKSSPQKLFRRRSLLSPSGRRLRSDKGTSLPPSPSLSFIVVVKAISGR